MTKQHPRVHRKRNQSASEQARELAIRARFQNEKPTLDELVGSGEYFPPVSNGEYWDIRKTMSMLKEIRVKGGFSLSDITAKTGIDRAALSRLENSVAANPTLQTIDRYADALGERLIVSRGIPTRISGNQLDSRETTTIFREAMSNYVIDTFTSQATGAASHALDFGFSSGSEFVDIGALHAVGV